MIAIVPHVVAHLVS